MTIRGRVLVAAALAAVVAVSVVVADRVGAKTPSGAAIPGPVSGAWLCPHGGDKDWQTWVSVGNATDHTASVRVTTFGEKGPAASSSFRMAGGSEKTVEVPDRERGSGTLVEFFGARVGAGWVTKGADGVAAEACLPDAGRSWMVGGGTTDRGETTRLVVMNASATDAAFDVTLLTAERAPIRSGALRGFVLKGRRAVSFEVGDVVLGQAAIGAVVQASLGSVAVALLGITDRGGIRAATAVPGPADRWILPGAGLDQAGATDLSLVDPGSGRTAASARLQTSDQQTLLDPVSDVSLPPGSVKTFHAEAVGGITVDVSGPAPIVASRRILGPKGDSAAISGVPAARRRWLVPPTVPPEGGTQYLILENPGNQEATVRVRLFGQGSGELGPLPVPGGRTMVVALLDIVGGAPVWASVTTDAGTIVAASASQSGSGKSYAEAMGLTGAG